MGLQAAIAASPVVVTAGPETPGLERVPEHREWMGWAQQGPPHCQASPLAMQTLSDEQDMDLRERLQSSLADYLKHVGDEQQVLASNADRIGHHLAEVCALVSS